MAATYVKCITRSADDWPALGIAVALDVDGAAVRKVDIVISAATAKPTRLKAAEAVVRGAADKFVVADMPFLSYRKGVAAALDSAQVLLRANLPLETVALPALVQDPADAQRIFASTGQSG